MQRNPPGSQLSNNLPCNVGVVNGKIQGINNFHSSSRGQKRFNMFMTNHHRNGTYSMLLLKKLRAFHYFRRKRSGQVCGRRHREKHAVITKSTALTLLSFSLCYNFPHVFLHTLFHVLIPRHLVWQPPAAKCGSCTLEM